MLNIHALERAIETQMREARIPGLALAIVRGDEVVYARGFGVTSVEDAGLPVTPQTLFSIGSISKVLTGTAIMRLVEAGKLDLDRPIAEYLPWLALRQPAAERQITLRMLLSHTSGLRMRNERSEPRLPRDPAGLETFIRDKVPQFAFLAEPGTVFAYSNAGLSLAGHIAETVAGKYFPDLMQELVFDPLEMRRTTYDRPVAMTYPLALPHQVNADGALKATHFYQTSTPGNPAGFAISTALDMANLAIMYLNRGRCGDTQFLAPESVAAMHTQHADLLAASGRGYGLTFWLHPYKGIQRVGHGGAIMTFRCYLELVPSAGVGLVLLANRCDLGSPALDTIVEGLLDQLLDLPGYVALPDAIAVASGIQAQYEGHYWNHINGIATVRRVEDQLHLDWNGWEVALQPIGDDRYLGQDAPLTAGFACDADGAVRFLLLGLPGWSMTFSRADPAFALDVTVWEQFAGVYWLDDELVDYAEKLTVRVADGQIWFNLDTEGEQEVLGVPIGEAAFASKYGLAEFEVVGGVVELAKLADEFVYRRVE